MHRGWPRAGGPDEQGQSRDLDESLARAVANGDDEAFSRLYERYAPRLYGYCWTILRDETNAQDALQSTWLKALVALRRRQRAAPVRPWLFRIAHNEAITVLRGLNSAATAASLAGPAPSAEELVLRRERLHQLLVDLLALPERARSALVLRELCGLTHEEIAIAQSTTVGGAKQLIFEARRELEESVAGRETACAEIRGKISAGDRRTLRGRAVRAHLRHCSACAAYRVAADERRERLRAVVPPLTPAVAAAVLRRVLTTSSPPVGASVAAGAGAGAGGGAATGAATGAGSATGAGTGAATGAGSATAGSGATAVAGGGAVTGAGKAVGASVMAKLVAGAAVGSVVAAGGAVAAGTAHAPGHAYRGARIAHQATRARPVADVDHLHPHHDPTPASRAARAPSSMTGPPRRHRHAHAAASPGIARRTARLGSPRPARHQIPPDHRRKAARHRVPPGPLRKATRSAVSAGRDRRPPRAAPGHAHRHVAHPAHLRRPTPPPHLRQLSRRSHSTHRPDPPHPRLPRHRAHPTHPPHRPRAPHGPRPPHHIRPSDLTPSSRG